MLTVFLGLFLPVLVSAQSGSTKRLPNIVLIIADDLGYGDLSCYGQKKFTTPNIDRLAREGMMFTQYYAGTSVCAPSRSALLTGQDTGHTPIRGNKSVSPEGQWPLPKSAVTLAELLKQAGYATGGFGKWGLGYIGTEGDPNAQGFDRFYGFNCQSLAHNYYPGHLWNNEQRVDLAGNAGDKFTDYAPALIHDEAIKFIDENRSNPFFLYYPTTLPHAELLVPDSCLAEFSGRFDPETPYNGTQPGGDHFREGPYGYQAKPHAAFAAMVTYFDRQVGALMLKLEQLGIADNTLVIVTSDNGPHLEGGADPDYFDSNGPFRGYKRDLYEGGIRVPFIVRWPGQIKPSQITDQLAVAWDILPTCAEIARVNAPGNIQGISLLPTLRHQSRQKQHDYVYWEFQERGGAKAIRQGPWKLVCLQTLKPTESKFELYNVTDDPGEKNDLAAKYSDRVELMKKLLVRARVPAPDFPFE